MKREHGDRFSNLNAEAAPATVSDEPAPLMPLHHPEANGTAGRLEQALEPRARRPAGTSRPTFMRGA